MVFMKNTHVPNVYQDYCLVTTNGIINLSLQKIYLCDT